MVIKVRYFLSLVSSNTEPMTCVIYLLHAIPTNFHAEPALPHDPPFPDFPNTVITENFSLFTEALVAIDDVFIYRLLSSSDTVPLENPATLQKNNI